MRQRTVLEQYSSDNAKGATMVFCETTENFHAMLKDTIDEVIIGVLGVRVHAALFQYLDQKYSVKSERVTDNLIVLCELLENTVGSAASGTIERLIARKIYEKLSIPFDLDHNCRLSDYVEVSKPS